MKNSLLKNHEKSYILKREVKHGFGNKIIGQSENYKQTVVMSEKTYDNVESANLQVREKSYLVKPVIAERQVVTRREEDSYYALFWF